MKSELCDISDDRYKYYGVSKEIAEAINIILSDSQKYAYSYKDKDDNYVWGVRPRNGIIHIDCVYLMVGLLGGSKKLTQRKKDAAAQSLTSIDQL